MVRYRSEIDVEHSCKVVEHAAAPVAWRGFCVEVCMGNARVIEPAISPVAFGAMAGFGCVGREQFAELDTIDLYM